MREQLAKILTKVLAPQSLQGWKRVAQSIDEGGLVRIHGT